MVKSKVPVKVLAEPRPITSFAFWFTVAFGGAASWVAAGRTFGVSNGRTTPVRPPTNPTMMAPSGRSAAAT